MMGLTGYDEMRCIGDCCGICGLVDASLGLEGTDVESGREWARVINKVMGRWSQRRLFNSKEVNLSSIPCKYLVYP